MDQSYEDERTPIYGATAPVLTTAVADCGVRVLYRDRTAGRDGDAVTQWPMSVRSFG
jgi:hypothetical protein